MLKDNDNFIALINAEFEEAAHDILTIEPSRLIASSHTELTN